MGPRTLTHVFGQEEVVARLRVAMEASWNDGCRLPHMCMVGPAGCGKTLLGQICAYETAANLHERLGQVLNSSAAVNSLLMSADDKDIVLIDEIHEMPPQSQTLLYRAMENRQVFVTGREEKTFNLKLKDFAIIACTTDEYAMLPPLRDRFKLILPFRHYDVDALAQITYQRAKMMGIDVELDVSHEIAKRAKNTPRLAIRILEACYRLARSRDEENITRQHFDESVVLEGLDSLGLDTNEQRYLHFLAERNGHPVRLFTIESALGIHRRTIQQVVEPYLLRARLIERAAQGRVITTAGLEHLGIAEPSEASIAGESS